ncbi:kanadaptin [Galendromus occidentalis]|uniref:Kanadaptin n=1 Tax=Galendromus occidentalis TaxID=34638 RepID=A0AAJ7SI47_9ACAR|nr:kanadaptin [Galendromus occidentalis]
MSGGAKVEDGEPEFKTPFLPPPEASKRVEPDALCKEPGTQPRGNGESSKSRGTEETESTRDTAPKKSVRKLLPAQKCPYEEPEWSGEPDSSYRVVVLRNGVIVTEEKLEKNYVVIGRHQDCDIVLEHPSISKFHAVLQFRRPPADAPEAAEKLKGFYLYDLGSTHGTQLNKEPIDRKSYHRLKVGHQFKFGFSTRTFILEGPTQDEEPESEFSITEIIQQRKERDLERERIQREARETAEDRPEQTEDTGINWGMAEDAEEDDDMISDVNPFALNNTMNEQLYLDDPKKTLRGWFEREGYELEYKVEDRGLGQFQCRIELPIDTGAGRSVIAETIVKGKKKEAVVQCALEACRILDRYGELRKAHHEAKKKKTKDWKEDDYYDSDEDEFLDRTGDIAQKRAQRKARLEKTEVVETYASLTEKIEKIDLRIAEIQNELEKSKEAEAQSKEMEGDCLDSFMKQLKAGTGLDKVKRSQLRTEQTKLIVERQHLVKLANIAKPAGLPPLRTAPSLGKASTSCLRAAIPMTGSIRGPKRPVMPLVGLPAKISRLKDGITSSESSESKED